MTTVRPRAPDRLIEHEPHFFERPSGYDKGLDRISCTGKTLILGCPIGEERERIYLEGFADGVKSTSGYDAKVETKIDPSPGPTGNGTEDIRRIEEWCRRHPVSNGGEPGWADPFPEDTGDLQEHGRQVLAWYGRHPEVCQDPPENPPEPASSEPESDPLREWWVRTAADDIDRSISKIREYGGWDLLVMGKTLAQIAGRELDDREAQELGCWIYVEGKLARAKSALIERRWPSDDTIFDTAFYLFMIRYIRTTGSWP